MAILGWKDLLVNLPVSLEGVCFVKDVSERYNTAASYSWKKLELLRRWGYLRYADRTRRGRGGYVLTLWGTTMSKKWRKESSESDSSSGDSSDT